MPTICKIISLLIGTGLFSCRFSQLESDYRSGGQINQSSQTGSPNRALAKAEEQMKVSGSLGTRYQLHEKMAPKGKKNQPRQ